MFEFRAVDHAFFFTSYSHVLQKQTDYYFYANNKITTIPTIRQNF